VAEWKIVFLEQYNPGMGVWQEQFTKLRVTKPFNLRADPFERGDQSIAYNRWLVDHAFVVMPTQAIVAQGLASFKEFPIRRTSNPPGHCRTLRRSLNDNAKGQPAAPPVLNMYGMKEGSEKAFDKGYNVLPIFKDRLNAKTLITTPNSDVSRGRSR
jgi:hypothetical protein